MVGVNCYGSCGQCAAAEERRRGGWAAAAALLAPTTANGRRRRSEVGGLLSRVIKRKLCLQTAPIISPLIPPAAPSGSSFPSPLPVRKDSWTDLYFSGKHKFCIRYFLFHMFSLFCFISWLKLLTPKSFFFLLLFIHLTVN